MIDPEVNEDLSNIIQRNNKTTEENIVLREAAKILIGQRNSLGEVVHSREIRMMPSKVRGKRLFATVSVKFELR